MTSLGKTLVLALGFSLAGAAGAQQGAANYPSKPITMVVPFSPGGVSDNVARPFAKLMGEKIGQPVVVENRPGAGGGVGMAHVSRAAPDGYTIMVTLPSVSAIPVAEKLDGRKPSYETSAFKALARISADPTVLAVHSDSPWKTFDEFVAAAKAKPGEISFSTSGIYGTTHVAMERLAHAVGVKLLHVPYSGGGEQVTALLGKHVQATTQSYGNISGHIASGRLRPLVVQSATRLPSLPNVPTMKELGYDAEYYLWAGVFVPAGVPQPIFDKLRAVAREVVENEDFKRVMERMDSPIQYLDAAEFEAFWREDERHQTAVINSLGKIQ